jgi:starch synthase (maltosyl-transferring)
MTFTISSGSAMPTDVIAGLMTTLTSDGPNDWIKVPFERHDDRTLVCRLTPKSSGLHSFRAEFSLDGGAAWLRDTVPDAWVLVDPPQVDGLRMYALIPTVSGTIADWTADLPRIAGMGFNAIHVLPVTAMDASQSPYAAKDLFEIDRGYLVDGSRSEGLDQLDAFLEAAKSLNIRLCFDLVLNHVGLTSEMTRRAPDWIVPDQDQADGFKRARFWSEQGWQNWNDLVLINYEHPSDDIRAEIWAYMTEYALFWAKFANDTGGLVRFDNLHSSNPDFIRCVTTALHSEYPELAVLAEYFTDERNMLLKGPEWGLNLILGTPWNYKFVPELRGFLSYIYGLSAQVRYFMPITSHDSGAPAQEFATADSTVPRYVAAALLGTGATGMPQGVEFGKSERIDFVGRKAKAAHPNEARFGHFIRQVNTILAENPAFRSGGNCRFIDNGHPAIIAAFRADPTSKSGGFLVACNFDIAHPQGLRIDLGFALETKGPYFCSELLSGGDPNFPSTQFDLVLPPCGAVVLQLPGRDPSRPETLAGEHHE